ncbi:B3 domain-containing protein REM16-like [Rhododendron vialii]|uniref:B3 domain-containing protein REM16-like n=1 Tax=Rhododendron vialii TaxID=182163 RepID=UPI00265FB3BE|nr:B3 domain-containing protein REM16-like [Rhododendron vialii]
MAQAASTPVSFIVVIRVSHIYRAFHKSIPSEWTLFHLPRKDQDSCCVREFSYFVRKCRHTEVNGGFRTKRNMKENLLEVGCYSTDCGGGFTPSKTSRNKESQKSTRLRKRTQFRSRVEANDVISHHGKHVIKYVAKDEQENELQMAHAASTPDGFIVVMRASHVYRAFLKLIPSEWAICHLPRKDQDVTLHVKEKTNNTWHARYYCGVCINSVGVIGG